MIESVGLFHSHGNVGGVESTSKRVHSLIGWHLEIKDTTTVIVLEKVGKGFDSLDSKKLELI